jgi:hypothetical protein
LSHDEEGTPELRSFRDLEGDRAPTGAAIGAVAGAVLPLVSWPIGLIAGAGYMLYNRVKK